MVEQNNAEPSRPFPTDKYYCHSDNMGNTRLYLRDGPLTARFVTTLPGSWVADSKEFVPIEELAVRSKRGVLSRLISFLIPRGAGEKYVL